MNVLMFVMAMLMLMSLMTYSKLNEYRIQSTLQYQFDNYMQHQERKYFNDRSLDKYNDTHVRTKKGTDKKSPRNSSSSKLPIGVLLDRSQQSVGTGKYDTVRILLKNLIINTYGNHNFLAEALKERPDSIDEIINRLPDAVQNLPNNQKVTKPKDLADVDLEDSLLNELFYKLLKGSQFLYEKKGKLIEEGYPPLVDFINTGKGSKIRVYLASREVLGVVFDLNAVDEIVRSRDFFYLEVVNDRIEAKEATERFKTMFEGSISPNASTDFVDFSVSKTDPRKR
jgi:hypothetical protein